MLLREHYINISTEYVCALFLGMYIGQIFTQGLTITAYLQSDTPSLIWIHPCAFLAAAKTQSTRFDQT